MRRIAAAIGITLTLAACGAGQTPAETTTPSQPQTQYGQDIQRAKDVADQVNQRESDLEQIVKDMGG